MIRLNDSYQNGQNAIVIYTFCERVAYVAVTDDDAPILSLNHIPDFLYVTALRWQLLTGRLDLTMEITQQGLTAEAAKQMQQIYIQSLNPTHQANFDPALDARNRPHVAEMTTGKIFTNGSQAARNFGVAASAVSACLMMKPYFRTVSGRRFIRTDEAINITPQDARAARYTGAVECVETGERWRSVADAAHAAGLTTPALVEHVNGGPSPLVGRTYRPAR